jgi:hypothetical protein
MVDFFTKIYNLTSSKSVFFNKIRFYTFFRVIIRVSSNIIIPIYYVLTRTNSKYVIKTNFTNSPKVIVSLTSFPSRINRLWLVIESLLRQNEKPDYLILWLSKEQFDSIDLLPKRLIKLQKRGLIIRICEGDLRSHKKYFYALSEFPNDVIITVDDDVFYNSNIISYLISLNKLFPDSICCNNASQITFDNQGDVLPYLQWKDVKEERIQSNNILPIGMGGVLYPPNSLDREVLNSAVFRDICFMADDIWLNAMSRIKGTRVSKSCFNSLHLPVINLKSSSLAEINVNNGLNDLQLSNLRIYCIKLFSFDPYSSVNKL